MKVDFIFPKASWVHLVLTNSPLGTTNDWSRHPSFSLYHLCHLEVLAPFHRPGCHRGAHPGAPTLARFSPVPRRTDAGSLEGKGEERAPASTPAPWLPSLGGFPSCRLIDSGLCHCPWVCAPGPGTRHPTWPNGQERLSISLHSVSLLATNTQKTSQGWAFSTKATFKFLAKKNARHICEAGGMGKLFGQTKLLQPHSPPEAHWTL